MENNFSIDSASITDRGLSNKRPNNEDSFLELNHKGVFAVADGVGGAQAGDVASQMAMEILGEAFNNLKPNEDAEELMRLAIERANAAIYQMAEDLPQLSTMATTVVALHLSGNIGTIGHVGDSRLYRLDEDGSLYRETMDHSVVEEEVRAGRMTVTQAANHPSRNVISRALGADSSVEVEMKTIMFEPNTTFLVCSDGITRHIDDFEIRELLMSNESSREICQKMKEICYERGAEDNLTAVIARVSSVVQENGLNLQNVDLEEATIASARPFEAPATETSNILELDDDEIQTAQLVMPESGHLPPIELDVDQAASPEEAEHEFEEDRSSPASTGMVSAEEPEHLFPEASSGIREAGYSAYKHPEMGENSFLSKVLLGIFTFLIGAVIGAGAIYVYMQNNPPPAIPAVPPEKTEDISQFGFELNRRNVDDNPAEFISRFGTNPGDAEDFFLLGRAHMLTGNYVDAKKALIESQNKLAMANEANAFVLANDIAAYLSIIETQNAQKVFGTEMKKGAAIAESEASESNANISNANVSNTNAVNN